MYLLINNKSSIRNNIHVHVFITKVPMEINGSEKKTAIGDGGF